MVLGHGRRVEDAECVETWVEWFKRTAHEAEKRMKELNIETWTVSYRRYKYCFASRIAQAGIVMWTQIAAMWEPEFNPMNLLIKLLVNNKC